MGKRIARLDTNYHPCIPGTSLNTTYKMGNTIKKQIDNREWVQQHASKMAITDVQETFEYVSTHHPFSGCATLPLPNLHGKETIDELATLADAVCVACVETLGFENTPSDIDFSELNTTAIANGAYIAKYHSDPLIRQQYLQFIDKWREFKASSK